jgi:hypothetical protein
MINFENLFIEPFIYAPPNTLKFKECIKDCPTAAAPILKGNIFYKPR